MKKIKILCKKTINKKENKLHLYFHGWLMSRVSKEIADKWHENGLKPYSLHVSDDGNQVKLTVNLLNQEAIDAVENLLIDENLESFEFESSIQKSFSIIKRVTEDITEKDLSSIFYRGDSNNEFTLKFVSATSFKSNGEYVMFPNIKLIIQSLMRQYNFIFENNKAIDEELFNEIMKTTKIVTYRTFSSYHPVHRTFIPGFKGDIKIRCKGNQTIVNYLAMLLEFANYSGVGIKNTMGMGSVVTKVVSKGDKYGNKIK